MSGGPRTPRPGHSTDLSGRSSRELAPPGDRASIGAMHYLLLYDLASDYLERRTPLRRAHLAYAQAAVDRGELLVGGALAEPADMAVLVFQGESPVAAEAFATSDPYVTNGLVTSWRVRRWTTVVGPLAAQPIAPGVA